MFVEIKDGEGKHVSNIEQLKALFNYATIGIIVTNGEGKIIDYNQFAEKQFEFSREEVLGKTVEAFMPKWFQAKHKQFREDYYQNPEVKHGRDLFAMKKGGSTFPVEVSLSHYTINDQTFVIAFVIDISVRKKQAELVLQQKSELESITTQLQNLNDELEQKVSDRTKMLQEALIELEKSKGELSQALEDKKELSELKSRFVTMASHEFRTPLSTILSSVFLMEKYNQMNPNDKMQKHIDRIKGAVSGIKGILEDFLSLGKLEEGLVQTRVEKVSAGEFSEEINTLVQELDEILKTSQKIYLNNTISEGVWVDRNFLRIILTNLLSNALKFTNENATIHVSLSITNDNLVISVCDNGIGISEDDQQHLLKRFFRAKNAGNIQGIGLGLHIAVRYLELMGGRIEVQSKIDEGSTFTIYIPQNIHNS